MKGINGSLGAMNIPLKPDAKLVKRRPYCLYPIYKEKVWKEIDRMLDVGIIVPHDHMRSLNVACVHDPFPISFIDEVLDNVGGRKSYSFMNGFFGYHQVIS